MPDIAEINGVAATPSSSVKKPVALVSTSFDAVLTNESTTQPPCMAQFMAMTGCDSDTASKALYTFGNWQDYTGNDQFPDVETAQRQLQAEVKDGTRELTSTGYGFRNDFQTPTLVEPTTQGKVVPMFNEESGSVTGVGFVGANGTKYTTSTLTDRSGIEKNVDGFKIGRKSLDEFAKSTGASSWSTLDLNSLYTKIQSKNAYGAVNGVKNNWNDI